MISQSSSADAASLAIDSGATRSDAGAVCTRTLGAGGTRKHSATVETATSIFNEANRTKDLLDHMELANMSGRRKRGTHDEQRCGLLVRRATRATALRLAAQKHASDRRPIACERSPMGVPQGSTVNRESILRY